MQSGKTHDGYDVVREYGMELGFSGLCSDHTDQGFFAFTLGLEFNEDAKGRHWPYLIIMVGRKVWQIGWLWGETKESVKNRVGEVWECGPRKDAA